MENTFLIILGKIIFISLILYLVIPTLYGFWDGAGPLISPKKSLREAFSFIKLSSQSNFYDLGSGTGRAMIIARKEFGSNVHGLEISPILFIFSKFNLYLNGIRKFYLYRKNYTKHNLEKADVVYCFLSEKNMLGMKCQLEKELKPGTWVISYGFPLEDWLPVKIIYLNNPGNMYIYKRGKL